MIHQGRAIERTRERDQTHCYWYIPSAPRVNYSLLIMVAPGMMKMASSDDFPLHLLAMNWVLLFEVSLCWIEYWIWEHLMYVLHMDNRGDNGILYWFTWCMFWYSTRGFPRWHWGNLCIGVDACFRPTFSDRNFGVILCCMLRDCYMIQLCYHCLEILH